jgi:hypothetical protein
MRSRNKSRKENKKMNFIVKVDDNSKRITLKVEKDKWPRIECLIKDSEPLLTCLTKDVVLRVILEGSIKIVPGKGNTLIIFLEDCEYYTSTNNLFQTIENSLRYFCDGRDESEKLIYAAFEHLFLKDGKYHLAYGNDSWTSLKRIAKKEVIGKKQVTQLLKVLRNGKEPVVLVDYANDDDKCRIIVGSLGCFNRNMSQYIKDLKATYGSDNIFPMLILNSKLKMAA